MALPAMLKWRINHFSFGFVMEVMYTDQVLLCTDLMEGFAFWFVSLLYQNLSGYIYVFIVTLV